MDNEGNKKPNLEGWAFLFSLAYLVQCDSERSGPVLPHHVRLPSDTLAGEDPLNRCPYAELMIEKVVRIFLSSFVDFLEVFNMGRFQESMNGFLQLHCRGRFLL